jgi:hypothetical protein
MNTTHQNPETTTSQLHTYDPPPPKKKKNWENITATPNHNLKIYETYTCNKNQN